MKKRMQMNLSLFTILQILSFILFEKKLILQVLTTSKYKKTNYYRSYQIKIVRYLTRHQWYAILLSQSWISPMVNSRVPAGTTIKTSIGNMANCRLRFTPSLQNHPRVNSANIDPSCIKAVLPRNFRISQMMNPCVSGRNHRNADVSKVKRPIAIWILYNNGVYTTAG